jgi:hypothetical protein
MMSEFQSCHFVFPFQIALVALAQVLVIAQATFFEPKQ